MTLLEYVCDQLLGPSNYTVGNGESYWHCPFCSSSRFHTRPSRSEYKDTWKCWSCGRWGDEDDLLQLFYPREYRRHREERLRVLRSDFEQDSQVVNLRALSSRQDSRSDPGADFLPGGSGSACLDLIETAANDLWHSDAKAFGWLRSRGLADQTIRAARLGLCNGNVLIPWFDARSIVQAVNVRRFDREPRYAMMRGSRKGIPYPDFLPDQRPVLLCEGELDTLLARQELGDLVQALTFGGVQDQPASVLADLAGKEVVCGFDADPAGDAGYEQLRKVLPQARRLRPPDGLDLTDLHAKVGLRGWFETLAAS
jgi:hypothetical protein